MSDETFVGRSLNTLSKSPRFKPVSRIVVVVSDSTQYSAGDNSGETMTVECPWGTQQIAIDLLELYRGFEYQPFEADGAFIDPAAEIGDGITAGNVYSGLFYEQINFGPLTKSSFSAPQNEQVNHEYPFKPQRDRQIKRDFLDVRSSLTVQAGLIEGKVEKIGGDPKSFSWKTEYNHHSWYSNGKEVVRFAADDFRFEGKLIAKSGLIGGMTIEDNYLHTGHGTWDHCEPGEIYTGPEGINHSDKFKLSASGHLVAESGEFKGTVQAGNIVYGRDNGTLNGGGISPGTITGGGGGQIASTTITGGNVTFGGTLGQVSTNADSINLINEKLTGVTTATNIHAQILRGDSLSVPPDGSFTFKGYAVKWAQIDPQTYALVRA